LKAYFLIFLLSFSFAATAQKVDSIYVHLYTDSLKKGTYNYINIDGKLTNGKFLPLDTSELIFTSSDGKFFGNSLWLDANFNKDKVWIKTVLKSNPLVSKEFTMHVKTTPDGKLKTLNDIMNEPKPANNKSQRKKN
jgi:hypothetical protein